jgi:hypothetical protein
MPAEIAAELAAEQAVIDIHEHARRANQEHVDSQTMFFHRSRTLAQVRGVSNISAAVKTAWMEQFGTELSQSRFNYLAHHPAHKRIRQACVQRVMSEDVPRLMRTDPDLSIDLLIEFCKYQLIELQKPENRDLGPGNVLRLRDEGTDAWRDEVSTSKRLPAAAMAIYGEILNTAMKGAFNASRLAKTVAVRGQAMVTQTNLYVGKATSLQSGQRLNDDGDAVPQHFTPQQVRTLIAQEAKEAGDGFFIPPDDDSGLSYHEHVAQMKRRLVEVEERQRLGLGQPRIDDEDLTSEAEPLVIEGAELDHRDVDAAGRLQLADATGDAAALPRQLQRIVASG